MGSEILGWNPDTPPTPTVPVDDRVIKTSAKVFVYSRMQSGQHNHLYQWKGTVYQWSDHGLTLSDATGGYGHKEQDGSVFIPWSNISHIRPFKS